MKRDDTFRLPENHEALAIYDLQDHPQLIEIVKLLARISAQRDYNKYLQEKSRTSRKEHGDD